MERSGESLSRVLHLETYSDKLAEKKGIDLKKVSV